MALASTSRLQLRYVDETVFGETPTVGETRELRFTGESLNYTLTKESSDEINKYRGVSSMIATSAEAAGSINGEFQYGEYDRFLEALLQDEWTEFGTGGVGAPFEATFTATTIEADVPTAGASSFELLAPGGWFSLKAPGNPNNNKLFRVSKTVPPTDTLITLDAGTPATPGAAVAGVSVTFSRLANGVTQPSFSIERESGDTGEFFLYRGQTLSSMTLNIATAAKTTVEFAFMGRDAARSQATALPDPALPSMPFQIMSGVSGTSCALWVDGAPLAGTFVNSIAMSYDNALRMQNAICSLGAVGIGSGTINLTLDLEVYFASGAKFYDEFLLNKNVEIAFTAFDTEGNGYVFTLPQANISTYTANGTAKDQDLIAQISMTGLMNLSTTNEDLRGKVLIIDRVGVVLPS